jgi:hypothetical protein
MSAWLPYDCLIPKLLRWHPGSARGICDSGFSNSGDLSAVVYVSDSAIVAAERWKNDNPVALPHSRGAHAMGSIGAEIFAVRVVGGDFSLQRHPAKRIDSERTRVQTVVTRAVKVDDLVTNPHDGVLDAVGCG